MNSAFNVDTQPESQGGQQCAAAGSGDLGGVAGDVESKYVEQGVAQTLIGDAIAIVVKKGSATRNVVQKIVLGGDEYGASAEVITPNAKMVPTVAHERGAIGQISFAFLKGAAGVHALAIDKESKGRRAHVIYQPYPPAEPRATSGGTQAA